MRWGWLRRLAAPPAALVRAENLRTDSALCAATVNALALEVLQLGDQTRREASPAERVGAFEYFSDFSSELGRPVSMRRRVDGGGGGGGGEAEVVLDHNALPPGVSVVQLKLSPDASAVAAVGDDCRLYVSGEARCVASAVGTCEWGTDGALYWTELDAHERPWRVRRECGALVYEEADAAHFVDLYRTKDDAHMTVTSNSKATSEVRVVLPGGKGLRVLSPRLPGVQYFVDHCPDQGWLVVTNRFSPQLDDYAACRVPEELGPEGLRWEQGEVLSAQGWHVEDVEVFRRHVVLFERCTASGGQAVRVLPDGGAVAALPQAAAITPGVNRDLDGAAVRFVVSGPLMPDCEVRVALAPAGGGARVMEVVDAVGGPPDLGDFECVRETVGAAEVPLTLVRRRGAEPGGPALLSCYGAYGRNLSLEYAVERLPLLRRGWTLAFAHVRGGGEKGPGWHHAGRLERKENTFADLFEAAELLRDRGHSVAASATSAGGLALGVAANRRPELFPGGLVLRVPFVDVLDAMQDESLALTVHEYDEWGDPRQPGVLARIRQFCPVANLGAGAHARPPPRMLVSADMDDLRVPFWGPMVFALGARDAGGDVLLRVRNDGHFGPSTQEGYAEMVAEEMAFLLEARAGGAVK